MADFVFTWLGAEATFKRLITELEYKVLKEHENQNKEKESAQVNSTPTGDLEGGTGGSEEGQELFSRSGIGQGDSNKAFK